MKTLGLALILLLSIATHGLAFTWVSSNQNSSAAVVPTLSTTLTNVGTGHLIVVCAGYYSTSAVSMTVSDGTSNFTPGTLLTQNNYYGQVFYKLNSTAPSTGTVNYTVSFDPPIATYPTVLVQELSYSGTAVVDAQANNTGNSLSAQSGYIDTTGNEEAVLACSDNQNEMLNRSIGGVDPDFIIAGGLTKTDLFGSLYSSPQTHIQATGDLYPVASDYVMSIISFKTAEGQTTPSLELQTVATGLSFPVYLTTPPGDNERLFIVEKTGMIRINKNGTLLETPFLDISSLVSKGVEQGLLGLAFDPKYAVNGRFYISYTDVSGASQIVRYLVSGNPDLAQTSPDKILLTIDQPKDQNHGGDIIFGPDGYLYVGIGDGGLLANGQKLTDLQGSLLRIDVSPQGDYAIPNDNPFLGNPPARAELWNYGLRNPRRYSFDRLTGDLYLADVGGKTREEVNVSTAAQGGGKGLNYGWGIVEGTICTPPTHNCDMTGLTLPVLDYDHSGGNCAVTGGYVYRGSAIPAIRGTYFYGDYCAGWVKSFVYQNGQAVNQEDWASLRPGGKITSFGQDAQGELYILTQQGGVYRIITTTAATTTTTTTRPTTTTTITTSTTTTTVKPVSDLILTQVEPAGGSVNAGGMLIINGTVKNQGTKTTTNYGVSYHLSLDSVYGGTDDINLKPNSKLSFVLPSGVTNTSTSSPTVPKNIKAGTYYVCASISSASGESSSTRSNNTLCSTGTVTVPPPDLVISELSTTTTTAKIGSTIHVSLSVTNQGGVQPDASSKVELHSSINAIYGDGDDIASSNRPSISKLAPGQTKTFANQSVKMPDTPGVYYICAKADADSVVTESDETNNTLCTTTTITVQP